MKTEVAPPQKQKGRGVHDVDEFANTMVMWGKYREGWFRDWMNVSFQFHHVQMDGGEGARFLEKL